MLIASLFSRRNDLFNAPPGTVPLGDLDAEDWQRVSARYATQLRVYLAVWAMLLSLACWIPAFARALLPLAFSVVGSLLVALLFLSLIIFWVPRRVRHTRYLLRDLDLHLQTGLLWRRTLSVAISRIQHLEISQGPLERGLDLSRLAVYTAGGMKSDLVIPGLPGDTAARLKTQILSAAEREDAVADAS